MTPQRDNMKAGLFVLVGILMFLFVVYTLFDFERLFEQTQQVKVSYTLDDGLKGLKAGSAVTLGHATIGEVVNIQNQWQEETNRVIGKVVTASFPKQYAIYQNAIFELNVPTFGTSTTLNIRDIGAGEIHEIGTIIPGTIGTMLIVDEIIANAGIGETQRRQFRQIVENIESITTRIREDYATLMPELKLTIAEAKAIMVKFHDAVADVKSVTTDLAHRKDMWFERVDGMTGSAKDSFDRVRDLIRDKELALRETVDQVHDVTKSLRDRTIHQIDEAMLKANAALGNFKMASSRIKSFVTGQRPVLERALANAQLTTDQLKLAAIEVRRSPWRLLYKPGEDELETDNLYDAARSFAQAAGALDATVMSLQAILADPSGDHEQIQEMLDHLEALFSKFEQTERVFWDSLKSQEGL